MQFSDTTTNSGLIQDCEFCLFGDNGFGQITSNSNRLYAFTNLLNRALDTVTNLIMECDGRWQFDDSNYTDLPIGQTNMVDGQQNYGLSVTHLKLLRVEVMDQTGIWNRLDPMDFNDIDNQGITEYLNGPGTPKYYDVQDGSLFLYPKPQTGYVTMTAGLKVYFQRAPSYFAYTDTTKVPGFSSTFHRLVSRWASYDYALFRQLPITKALRDEITVLEGQLQDYYASRQPDEPLQIRIKETSWN